MVAARTTPRKAVKAESAAKEESVCLSDVCDGDMNESVTLAECSGCFRSFAKDCSFMMAGAEVEFLYSSKQACWCKDCHTVWRLLYKARLTLTLLLRFLSTWENRTFALEI